MPVLVRKRAGEMRFAITKCRDGSADCVRMDLVGILYEQVDGAGACRLSLATEPRDAAIEIDLNTL